MTVRIRGIYATALTALLDDVVQASPPIARRFEASFPVEHADATVDTTDDRQAVGVHGTDDAVEAITTALTGIARDTLAWEASLPRGAVYAGEISETLGSGALVDCGPGTGFLPYSKTTRRVEDGDRLRVQVTDPEPPWSDDRPVLDTTVRVHGHLAELVRGGAVDNARTPELADILPADPPEGWGVAWGRDADDADLDALSATLGGLGERAQALDEALVDAPAPGDAAPHTYWVGDATRWVWFGRESRFALDVRRREVLSTMAGHHRIKAGGHGASTAVDFVERVCGDARADEAFPFEAVAAQFGPREGDSLRIGHGKPDGQRFELGPGEVMSVADGEVVLRRELAGHGTYDGLGVEQHAGDVATTKFREGRWWYPTVYRGEDGTHRGTYVNICTPVELFPSQARYVDLHVDVLEHADGAVERVDEDELAAAVDAGHLSPELAERAREVASAVESAL
jgi:hypothetical protein